MWYIVVNLNVVSKYRVNNYFYLIYRVIFSDTLPIYSEALPLYTTCPPPRERTACSNQYLLCSLVVRNRLFDLEVC